MTGVYLSIKAYFLQVIKKIVFLGGDYLKGGIIHDLWHGVERGRLYTRGIIYEGELCIGVLGPVQVWNFSGVEPDSSRLDRGAA